MKFILVVALRSISKTKSVLVIGQKSACLLNSSQPFWDNAKATKIQLYYENHGLYNIQYNKTHKRIHIRVVPIWGTKRSVAQKQNQNHNRVFLYDQLVSESEIGGAGSSCSMLPIEPISSSLCALPACTNVRKRDPLLMCQHERTWYNSVVIVTTHECNYFNSDST